jgi:hypothetical protein
MTQMLANLGEKSRIGLMYQRQYGGVMITNRSRGYQLFGMIPLEIDTIPPK